MTTYLARVVDLLPVQCFFLNKNLELPSLWPLTFQLNYTVQVPAVYFWLSSKLSDKYKFQTEEFLS